MDRRKFIKTGALATTGAALAAQSLFASSCSGANDK
ncbi:MAG: twin-arginine translocation signal domain-containing protein, partial [Tannerella sp.]|nr:twin-arginine translocation signal domain-containing protein [Tannerella sp.]